MGSVRSVIKYTSHVSENSHSQSYTYIAGKTANQQRFIMGN